ncbi:hypothetical protein OIY81_2369 [Cryptosporidium canis]|nr:hypothetical protein OIY81_2369 [Cryptosporidium canis]
MDEGGALEVRGKEEFMQETGRDHGGQEEVAESGSDLAAENERLRAAGEFEWVAGVSREEQAGVAGVSAESLRFGDFVFSLSAREQGLGAREEHIAGVLAEIQGGGGGDGEQDEGAARVKEQHTAGVDSEDQWFGGFLQGFRAQDSLDAEEQGRAGGGVLQDVRRAEKRGGHSSEGGAGAADSESVGYEHKHGSESGGRDREAEVRLGRPGRPHEGAAFGGLPGRGLGPSWPDGRGGSAWRGASYGPAGSGGSDWDLWGGVCLGGCVCWAGRCSEGRLRGPGDRDRPADPAGGLPAEHGGAEAAEPQLEGRAEGVPVPLKRDKQVQTLTQERRALMHEISELKTLWQHETKKREIYEEQCKMIIQNFNRIVHGTGEVSTSEFYSDLEIQVPEGIGFDNSNNKERVMINRGVVDMVYSDIMEQNTQLKIQVSKLIEGIELDSQIQVRKLTSEIASYKDRFERIHSERDELVSQYQALVSKLESENAKLKEERDLAGESASKDAGGREEQEELQPEKGAAGEGALPGQSVFVKQLGEVTEMCKTLSERLTSEIESSTQCRSELSRYKAQCEYMESMGERNRKRLDELFEERDKLYMQVNDLKREQDGRDLEQQELRERLSSKESEIQELRRENDHQRQSISSLNACIADLRSDIEQGIKQRSQDNALQRDVISQLQGELEGRCVEINSMRKSQDAILQREFEESQRLRQQLRAEHDRYQSADSRLRELQAERDGLERRLGELESELRSRPEPAAVSSPEGPGRRSLAGVVEGPGEAGGVEAAGSVEGEEEKEDRSKEVAELRVQLEESRKLQNYWKELVQSVEKQLEAKTKDLEERMATEESLRGELESRREEVRQIEEDSQKELARLNESISAMTKRISSMDEEVVKREAALREDLSHVTEENAILKKEAEELRQMEQDLRGQYQNIVRMHSLDIERLQNANKQCLELKEELGSLREKSKKSEDESTSLVMEMQGDILHLRHQLESYTKKYETAKADSQSLREVVNRLKTEHQVPVGLEAEAAEGGPREGDLEETEEKAGDERRFSIQSGSSTAGGSSAAASLMLMRKVHALTSSVEELDAKLDESKIEIQRLTFERKSLREENELLQRRLTEELERVSEFASKAEANESTLIRLGEMVTLRESNDRLRRELIQATERHNSLERQLEQASRESDPLRCEISKLEAQVGDLKSLCEEKSALSKSWEEQYNRILLSYENINPSEVSQIREEVGKLRAANEELKGILATKGQEIEKLLAEKQQEHASSEELQQTKQQMEQLRKVYMSTNQKLNEERSRCTRLENELKKQSSQSQAQAQPQPQTQPQIQGGAAGGSNPSGSQDGGSSSSSSQKPAGQKPTSQDIKSISQATESLVCTVLKLAKLSILRKETEGGGGGKGLKPKSSSSPQSGSSPQSSAPSAPSTGAKASAPGDSANSSSGSSKTTSSSAAAGSLSRSSSGSTHASASATRGSSAPSGSGTSSSSRRMSLTESTSSSKAPLPSKTSSSAPLQSSQSSKESRSRAAPSSSSSSGSSSSSSSSSGPGPGSGPGSDSGPGPGSDSGPGSGPGSSSSRQSRSSSDLSRKQRASEEPASSSCVPPHKKRPEAEAGSEHRDSVGSSSRGHK